MDALAAYSTKQKLMVILDEFQEIASYSEEGFEKRLRSHIQKHSKEMKIMTRRENEFMLVWDSLTPNQRKALRLLAVTGGQGIYYTESLHRFGFKSGSILKRALESLSSRQIVTKNKTHHIHDAMLRKWVLRNFSG